jgi:prepilin-type N-terminal cleavage/methylation domain-containing protein
MVCIHNRHRAHESIKVSPRYYRGFTLTELLIVIAIIGILSSVVIAALNSSRAKGRDAARKQQVHQIVAAINLYATDNNGAFPNYSVSCMGVPTGSTCWPGYVLNGGGSGLPGNTALMTLLAPYMPTVPKDPQPNRSVGDAYVYFNGSADIHCNGTDTIPTGSWVAWEPDVVNPNTDAACAPGNYACCSGIGCGSHNFCVYKVNQ